MNLNWHVIVTLFRTELRMVFRDRRILFTSILLPLVVTPLLFLASSHTLKKREKTLEQATVRYALTGSRADATRALLAQAKLLPTPSTNSGSVHRPLLAETQTADPMAALNAGDLELVIEGLSAEEAKADLPAATKSNAAPAQVSADEKIIAGLPVVRLVFRADRDTSSSAADRVHSLLRELRFDQQTSLLRTSGFPVPPPEVAQIETKDLASGGQVAGLTLGRMITLFVLLFVLMGGAVVATDSLAGEKERGTLETLLTTSAQRVEVLIAKNLVILALGLVITFLQAGNLLVYIGFKLLPVSVSFAGAVTPWTAALLFVLFLPVAALAANVLLLVSGLSRSYKEAQLYFFPVFILSLVPAMASLLPGISLRSAIVLVPVANLSIAAREVLVGILDWPMIVLAWVVTAAAAAWATRLGVKVLSAERLISPAASTDAVQFGGGPALFERHVVRWFAVLWGVLLMVSNYTQEMDLRLQLVINLVVIFFGASCVMMWKYRLDPVQALALRKPHPAAWLSVLLGVPGGLLVATGLFKLTSSFLPAPEKMLEQFEQSLLPKDVPVAQLIVFMTVLPGIFEEIAFRGLLLHGLRRRLQPATLALVVGLFFGVFHVALFRFVPTVTLGILFAVLTMLTGSIFPAMLWHMLSNGLGILLHLQGIPPTELDLPGYVSGAGLLAMAFYIAWRHRRPYPGLREQRWR